MLLRARKYGLVQFDGEILYQRRDDDVIITMQKSYGEIFRTFKYSGDPANLGKIVPDDGSPVPDTPLIRSKRKMSEPALEMTRSDDMKASTSPKISKSYIKDELKFKRKSSEFFVKKAENFDSIDNPTEFAIGVKRQTSEQNLCTSMSEESDKTKVFDSRIEDLVKSKTLSETQVQIHHKMVKNNKNKKNENWTVLENCTKPGALLSGSTDVKFLRNGTSNDNEQSENSKTVDGEQFDSTNISMHKNNHKSIKKFLSKSFTMPILESPAEMHFAVNEPKSAATLASTLSSTAESDENVDTKSNRTAEFPDTSEMVAATSQDIMLTISYDDIVKRTNGETMFAVNKTKPAARSLILDHNTTATNEASDIITRNRRNELLCDTVDTVSATSNHVSVTLCPVDKVDRTYTGISSNARPNSESREPETACEVRSQHFARHDSLKYVKPLPSKTSKLIQIHNTANSVIVKVKGSLFGIAQDLGRYTQGIHDASSKSHSNTEYDANNEGAGECHSPKHNSVKVESDRIFNLKSNEHISLAEKCEMAYCFNLLPLTLNTSFSLTLAVNQIIKAVKTCKITDAQKYQTGGEIDKLPVNILGMLSIDCGHGYIHESVYCSESDLENETNFPISVSETNCSIFREIKHSEKDNERTAAYKHQRATTPRSPMNKNSGVECDSKFHETKAVIVDLFESSVVYDFNLNEDDYEIDSDSYDEDLTEVEPVDERRLLVQIPVEMG